MSETITDAPQERAAESSVSAAFIPLAAKKRDRTIVSSPRIHRMQLTHFLLFDATPLLATAAVLLALPFRGPSALDLALFFVLWLATGLGVSVGYHRLFSHRSFRCGQEVEIALLVLGSMAARGPMLSWAAMHRRHHEKSDREGDLHSPNLHGETKAGRLRGWLHAHFTWMIRHDYPNVAYYAADLMKEPALLRWNRRYFLCVGAGLATPALIAGLATGSWSGALWGFAWGGVVRIFVVEQTMSAINSVTHLFGTQPFDSRGDGSRNLGFLGALSWGEAWHNNHHAFPWSAAFGLTWRQIDPGFLFIRALERLGLAWDVRKPDCARIAARRLEGRDDVEIGSRAADAARKT